MRNKRKNERTYDYETLRNEREHGFYWYSAIWRILRPILIVFTAVLIVIGLLATAYNTISELFITGVDLEDPNEYAFTISSGDSLSLVSTNLEEAELIKNSTVFKYYADFAGLGQKFQVGDYTLTKMMDIFEIADILTTGDGQATTTNITIIPGYTIEDISDYLVEKGIFDDEEETEFLHICETGEGVEDYYFIQEVLQTARVDERLYLLEGYLAPNTYEIYLSATPLEIIKKLLTQTDKVYTADYQTRADELGMTMDEIIILATLIEKEAKTSDFSKVSAVFHNRLTDGMLLQSDVTIHYVTGVRRMSLKNSDLAVESPYNTYKYTGLPLGAICNPSPEAIYAALYPDEGYIAEKYLYFCSKDPDTGELYFSQTLEEHTRAVEIYAPLWEAYDEERGM